MPGSSSIALNSSFIAEVSPPVTDSKSGNSFSFCDQLVGTSNVSVCCEFVSTLYEECKETSRRLAEYYLTTKMVQSLLAGELGYHSVMAVIPDSIAQLGARFHIACLIKGALFTFATDAFGHGIDKVKNATLFSSLEEYLSKPSLYEEFRETSRRLAEHYLTTKMVQSLLAGELGYHAVMAVIPNWLAQLGARFHIACLIKGAFFTFATDAFNHGIDKVKNTALFSNLEEYLSKPLSEKKDEL
ncbi:hypothetical protein REG_0273 [Candidatus Regiella insecticola LSR1]|uniref:Uncharacterized protein n=1 Tax=Candidatus Regiella insecticola LSR1 TaxID=663321 RepID=E0WQS9_9ENTR|nr:hypothetical protein [Candidatus Regiella insecticola]EFL92489.1 hypothetical protein REG_0273 [Candidatus Regiella insecticola LSR1]